MYICADEHKAGEKDSIVTDWEVEGGVAGGGDIGWWGAVKS